MSNRNDKLNMSAAFTAHFLFSYFDTTSVAHDAFVANTFVLAAGTFIVFCRTEDALAEQAVALGLVCTIVNGLRFGNLAETALEDFLR